MTEERSRSQILFNFLPEQTADLEGGVWKVTEWDSPKDVSNQVDRNSLQNGLLRQIGPWAVNGNDSGMAAALRSGRDVTVLSVIPNRGVIADPFPNVWRCTHCSRVHRSTSIKCECGSGAQLHQIVFVAHCKKCGAIQDPRIPRCDVHNKSRIHLPGTAALSDIVFDCPTCHKRLNSGMFRFPKCNCGERMEVSHHRTASVYVPRTITLVNPPSLDDIYTLRQVGGQEKALGWTLTGLQERTIKEQKPTEEELRTRYRADNLSEKVIDTIVDEKKAAGELASKDALEILPTNRDETIEESLLLVFATLQGRYRTADLVAQTGHNETLIEKYEKSYPRKFARVGLSDVDLIGNFPVLTGAFGYTRGEYTAGASTLVPFKNSRGEYIVYGDIADTEALLFRLDPVMVLRWLRRRGASLTEHTEPFHAHQEILKRVRLPGTSVRHEPDEFGNDVYRLVHSYAHRLMKTISVYSGIEHTALSEMLLPHHLGFFVYAVPRGNFVLGGLQAIFETELDAMLRELIGQDFRCPLDPQCWNDQAACMACLHVGEPSCTDFNRNLSRRTLFGSSGFFYETAWT